MLLISGNQILMTLIKNHSDYASSAAFYFLSSFRDEHSQFKEPCHCSYKNYWQ